MNGLGKAAIAGLAVLGISACDDGASLEPLTDAGQCYDAAPSTPWWHITGRAMPGQVILSPDGAHMAWRRESTRGQGHWCVGPVAQPFQANLYQRSAEFATWTEAEGLLLGAPGQVTLAGLTQEGVTSFSEFLDEVRPSAPGGTLSGTSWTTGRTDSPPTQKIAVRQRGLAEQLVFARRAGAGFELLSQAISPHDRIVQAWVIGEAGLAVLARGAAHPDAPVELSLNHPFGNPVPLGREHFGHIQPVAVADETGLHALYTGAPGAPRLRRLDLTAGAIDPAPIIAEDPPAYLPVLAPGGRLVAIHDDAISPRPRAVASEIADMIDQLSNAGQVADTDISVRLVSVNELLTDAIFERVTQTGAAHYVHVDRDGGSVTAFRFTQHSTPAYAVDRFAARAANGQPAPALLFRPREMAEDTPLMLTLHGGPKGHDMAVANLYQNTGLRHGLPVLAVNYRGSTGHGLAHERAGDMEFDSGMIADISAAISESFDRLGGPRPLLITGGSFGGHLAFASAREWAAETCAVIANAPAADLVAFQERAWSHMGDATNAYWAALYGRWYDAEDAQRLIAASAVTRPDDWDIPVAVITGAEDRITPLDQVSRLADVYADVLFAPFEPIEGAGHQLRFHQFAPVFDDALQRALSGPCAF